MPPPMSFLFLQGISPADESGASLQRTRKGSGQTARLERSVWFRARRIALREVTKRKVLVSALASSCREPWAVGVLPSPSLALLDFGAPLQPPHRPSLAPGRLPAPSARLRSPRLHHAGLDVLADGLVVVMVVMVIRAAGRWVEGRDAVEIEDEILPVAHRAGVVLVPRQAHCGERKREKVSPRKALGTEWVGSRENGDSCPGVKWRDGNP